MRDVRRQNENGGERSWLNSSSTVPTASSRWRHQMKCLVSRSTVLHAMERSICRLLCPSKRHRLRSNQRCGRARIAGSRFFRRRSSASTAGSSWMAEEGKPHPKSQRRRAFLLRTKYGKDRLHISTTSGTSSSACCSSPCLDSASS